MLVADSAEPIAGRAGQAPERRGSPAARVLWVDQARGLGIILVVLGHTLGGLIHSSILPESGWPLAVSLWIYSFHMPLFFFLSGLFAPRLMQQSPRDFVWNRVSSLVYPYFLWSVLQTIVQASLSGVTNNSANFTSLLSIAYQPVFQFWFLYVLTLVSCAARMLVGLGASALVVLACASLLYFGPDFGLVGFWGVLGQVKAYAIYYACGFAYGGLTRLAPLSKGWACGAALVSFTALSIPEGQGAPMSFLAFSMALAGILGTLGASMATSSLRSLRWLGYLGRFSMEIYVAHTLASAGFRIVLQRIAGVMEPWPHLFGGVLVGLVAPILLVLVCRRLHIKYLFSLRGAWA